METGDFHDTHSPAWRPALRHRTRCKRAHSAKAEIYRPWCAQYYGFGGGGTNCGFISYEQCMMTARGAGAWCVQNPWYLAYGDGSQKTAATARRARSQQR
jgi:hypothetical protein